MADWGSTAQAIHGQPKQPEPTSSEPGGLLGLLQDYLRGN